jgi:ACS family glucarate transporter-like MFS transporter
MGFPAYGQAGGPAIASALIVAMIYVGGWRFSFLVLAALDLIVIVPIFLFLVRDTPEQSSAVNPAELAYIQDGRRVARQPSAPSSQEWIATLRDPRFWFVTIGFTVTPFAFFALTTWVPSYLVEVRHFSKAAMGAWLSAGYLIAIGEVILATALADYLRSPGLIGGIALALAAVNLLIGIQAPNPDVAAILITTGQGGCLTASMMAITLLQRYFKPAVLGRLSGTTTAIASIGGGISPTLLGWLLDVGKGNYTPSFSIVAVFLIIGAIVFVACLGVRPKPDELQVATI